MCNNECYDEISTLNSLSILSYQLVNFIDKTTENSSTDNNKNNNKLLKESIEVNEEKKLTISDNIANDKNLSSISLWNLENSNHDRSQPLLPPSFFTASSKSSSTSSLHQTEVTVLDQNQISHLGHLHSLHSTSSSAKTAVLSRTMLGNGVIPPGLLPPLDHYRLQLYNYAMVERLRCSQYHNASSLSMCPPNYPNAPAAASVVNNPYGSRFALSMSLFHNRVFQPEEPKPQHSYIGLIAMAILSSPESKLVLSDIYQHILDNYPYFRTRGPGWRNSIRHNLSLNDCFIKAGRSANGKGHYWAIHPANLEDFKKGDFRRRKAQRKVRKHMGLAVDDEGTDSPSPPTLAVTPPPHPPNVVTGPFCPNSWAAAAVVASGTPTANVMANIYSQSRKRQFDVASLLAPDEDNNHQAVRFLQNESHFFKGPVTKRLSLPNSNEIDEYIDVVASDVEENIRQISNKVPSQQNKDENNCFNSVPLTISSSALIENKEIQSINDETPIDSPCSNQMDDDISGPRTGSSSPTAWQGLIQQWPNNFNSLGIDGSNSSLSTTMDPRVLERYYGQYMAAAAAQQIAVTKKTVVVGNLLNSNNHSLISRETSLNADTKNDSEILIQNHKNKTIVIDNNNRNFNSAEVTGTGPLEMTMRSHSQHHQDNSEQHQRIEFLALQTNDS